MAIPIKERGIRWVESYSGEKSAHLKKEMDSQIGPGAYCRWEGHDSVTGNDYYVVVSPGFSKKKGYHFFAGLRKMPADHGASGKKFANQREAMSHARDTWQVPPPKDKPLTTQGYSIQDISRVPVLQDLQHKGKGASSDGKMTKESSMLGSAGDQAAIRRRLGGRVTPEILCYAYKAAPFIGFIPAMFARPRFSGIDVTNVPVGHEVYDEFSGQVQPMSRDEGIKPAPIAATYEPPNKEEFDKVFKQGVWTANPIIDATGGAVTRKTPFHTEDIPGQYHRATWRNMRMTPTISFSMNSFANTVTLWTALKKLGEKKRDRSEYWDPKKKASGEIADVVLPREVLRFMEDRDLTKLQKGSSIRNRIPVQINMRADLFEQVNEMVKPYDGIITVGIPEQKTLMRALDDSNRQGKEFDWDEPFFEEIKASGSSLIRYDTEGVPYMIKPLYEPFTGEEENRGDSVTHEYVVADPVALMAPYAGNSLKKLGQQHEILEALHSGPNDENLKSTMRRLLVEYYEDEEYTDNELLPLLADAEGIDAFKQHFNTQASEFAAFIAKKVSSGQRDDGFEQASQELTQGVNGLAAAKEAGKQRELNAIHWNIRSYLKGFQYLAQSNKVALSHDQFRHSATCGLKLGHPRSKVPDLDEMMLPKGGHEGDPSGNFEEIEQSPLEFTVNLPKEVITGEDGSTQEVHACRRYDPKSKMYVYGPAPEGTNPQQGSNTGLGGYPLLIKDTSLRMSSPSGRSHVISGGETKRYKTVPGPNGPEIITGSPYDAFIAPEYASSKGTDAPMIVRDQNRFGFGAYYQEHYAFEPSISGVGKNKGIPGRKERSRPLITADPATSPENYKVSSEDEGEVDLSSQAFKVGRGVYFNNVKVGAQMMAKVLNKDVSELGPITMLDSHTQRFIDENAQISIRYSASIDLYEQEKANPEFFDEAGNIRPLSAEVVDSLIKKEHALLSEGFENSKNIDPVKYEFGKTCQNCALKKGLNAPEMQSVRKAYRTAVKQAVEDPVSAFKRTEWEAFGLSYVDENGQEQYVFDKDDTVLLFGDKKIAEANLAAIQALPANQDKKLQVKSIGSVVLPHSLHEVPDAPHVMHQDKFEKHVREQYQRKQPQIPAQPVPAPAPAQPQPQAQPPQLPAPVPDQPPVPPAQAAVVQRLVALADKLDSAGRKEEADAVDRVLNATIGKTCQSQ